MNVKQVLKLVDAAPCFWFDGSKTAGDVNSKDVREGDKGVGCRNAPAEMRNNTIYVYKSFKAR